MTIKLDKEAVKELESTVDECKRIKSYCMTFFDGLESILSVNKVSLLFTLSKDDIVKLKKAEKVITDVYDSVNETQTEKENCLV